jgi:predicted RNase H-like HicB family nuclease
MKIVVTPFSSDGETVKWSAHYPELKQFMGIGSSETQAIANLKGLLKIGLDLLDEPKIILAKDTWWVAGDFAFGLTMEEAHINYLKKNGLIR